MSGWFCDCCHYDTPPCDYCSADADTVAMTIAGIGNNMCTCTGLPGTYILTRDPSNACIWRGTLPSFACIGGATVYGRISATVISLYGQFRWFAQAEFWALDGIQFTTQTLVQWTWNSGGNTPFDCTATRSLSQYSLYERMPLCNWGSATCTLN